MNKNTKTVKTSVKRGTRAAEAPKTTSSLPAQAAVTASPPASAPRKNQVALELVRPGASQVAVAGSFNSWSPEGTPLKPVGSDRWVGSLELAPGRHEYLFVVDGQWLTDPHAAEAVQNPYGGRNSVLIVKA